MEVKSIIEKIRKNEVEPLESYFALQIGLEAIKGVIFVFENDKVEIVSVSQEIFWENEEELLEISDRVFTSALEKIPGDKNLKEPNNVVFGLPFSWVKEEKVVPDKLPVLKEICKGLDLKPTGFVVSIEAILHQLKIKEGIPATAILVEVLGSKLLVSLARLGRVKGVEVVERSEDPALDLVEGLSRFKEDEATPARILVYGREEDLDEVKQSFIDYQWMSEEGLSSNLSFLHLPKIEDLSADFEVKAVAFAGGVEYAKTLGMSVLPESQPSKIEEEGADDSQERSTDDGFEKDEIKEQRGDEENFITADEIGFQKEDLSNLPEQESFPSPPEPVLQNEELAEKATISQSRGVDLKRFLSFLPSFSFRAKSKLFLVLGLGFLVLLVIFVGLFVAWWRLPKAQVTLFVEPKLLEKEFRIKLDPGVEEIDKENLVLPARKVSVDLAGDKSIAVTGSKIIGDPAKGEITVYNGTSNSKTFEKGTLVETSSGVEFELDDDVTVASQSSAADPPGQAKVAVTASKIGVEGNLATGTEFLIANYAKTDYVAKNESAFTGGVSREVQAVSEEDRDDLLALLKDELKSKMSDKLKGKLDPDQEIVEDSIQEEILSSSFDKEIGEESESLTLSLKLGATALTYSEKEIKELIEGEMLSLVPENYDYDSEKTSISFSLASMQKDGSALFDVVFSADLRPRIDIESVKASLVGKKPEIAEVYLSSLNGVVGHEVSFSPSLPSKIQTFPRLVKNIQIDVGFKP